VAAGAGGGAFLKGLHAGLVDELGGFLHDDGSIVFSGLGGGGGAVVELLVQLINLEFGEVEHDCGGGSGLSGSGSRLSDGGSDDLRAVRILVSCEAI
jgi:hypothetical protein